MFRLNRSTLARILKIAAIHLAAFAVALSITALVNRERKIEREATFDASQPEAKDVKDESNTPHQPYFSLATNRSYATNEKARVWLNYRDVDEIDFRVYRVKDPVKFFKQLDNPHQVGEDEKKAVESDYHRRPTLLEATREFKNWIYNTIKNYVRAQVKHEWRKAFNERFRRDEGPSRTPLNVADYARVPLLNPDQLVNSWREKLPPLANDYDRRMIPLTEREPGVYLVEAVNGDLRAYSIAIITDLTLVQKTSSGGDVLIYTVNRRTGAPRAHVNVVLTRGKETLRTGATDNQGILKTAVERKPDKEATNNEATNDEEVTTAESARDNYLVMATDADHFAINDLDSFYFNEYGEEYSGDSENLTSFIYTDRPVYRPNQKVYFKGILRRLDQNKYAMVQSETVNVTIEDPANGKVYERDLTLSPRGTFSGEVDIADEAPLGSYYIKAHVGEAEASGYFEVEEYKKPEFKVKVSAPQQFAPVGEKVSFKIDAHYFFGAPVTGAAVKYYIYRSRYYHYWWSSEDEETDEIGEADPTSDGEDGYGSIGGDIADEGEGTLDAKGQMQVEFEVPQPEENDFWDYSYRLTAEVTDASRRTIPGEASFVGTRGRTVASASPEKYIYSQGDTAKIRVRTADYAGHPLPASVTLKFFKHTWEKVTAKSSAGYEYQTYEERNDELATVDVMTNAQGEAQFDYTANTPGNISLKIFIHEGNKEIAANGGSMWVSDQLNQWTESDYENDGSIDLVPDKKSYKPGDTAHVLVILPDDKTHLLVTTELASVMTAREVDVTGRNVILDVPIEGRFEPNFYLSVTYVKDNDLYTGQQRLVVPARDKMLKLEIIPNKTEYKPRETASYTISARNSDGSPAAGAEVSLGVVDEAIYSIAPESAGDIRRDFYGRRYNEVQTALATSFSFIGFAGEKPITLARNNKRAFQLADFKNESDYVEPAVRREFKDTAFWQPDVVTGADGKATVQFKLPDNLTTWRATARAVTADTRVGVAVEKVVARKDLILRLETPRFLTEGDTVTISGIVHNFLKSDKQTRISLEVNGARLIGSSVQVVNIPRQGERRIDWRISAQQAGQLRLLAKALTDTESDAVEMPLEVVPHGLKQTKGATATLANDAEEQTLSLDVPENADAQARRLHIEVAPSIASTLFGALDYLTSYPYGCTEQTMSGFLPDVIVAQALKDVPNASVRSTNDLNQKVERGIDRLYSFQHGDGGWGWWKDDKSDPFMTAYVVDGLTQALRAGYQVDQPRIARARERLTAMLEADRNDEGQPLELETRAFMTYALNESGEADGKWTDKLFARRKDLQPYGRALLALALHARGDDERGRTVASEIENTATVDDSGAHWDSQRKHIGYEFAEVNSTEATALSLKALARLNPHSSLLARTARWLVNNRRSGVYWATTEDTAFAIFGLVDYLKVSDEMSPDYTVEVYLGGEQLIARRMTATDTAQRFVIERKGRAVRGGMNQLRIVKHGRGVLYVSANLEYFTGEEETPAQASAQLQITREYLRLRVDENDGKPAWKVEPLEGEVRAGDLIVVRLHLTGAPARYLMIEDPIPAGGEQVAFVGGLNLNYSTGQWSDWYSSREFRDERTVFFMSSFDGDTTFQYALRVQTPGDFRVAPARVELMYQPTVQANTGNARLSILDKQ